MSFPLRIVEDYDVDRLEVQVQQCIKLTSTNHPIGLIPVFEFVLSYKTVNGREATGWKKRTSPCGCQRAGTGRREPAIGGCQLLVKGEQAHREGSPDNF